MIRLIILTWVLGILYLIGGRYYETDSEVEVKNERLYYKGTNNLVPSKSKEEFEKTEPAKDKDCKT